MPGIKNTYRFTADSGLIPQLIVGWMEWYQRYVTNPATYNIPVFSGVAAPTSNRCVRITKSQPIDPTNPLWDDYTSYGLAGGVFSFPEFQRDANGAAPGGINPLSGDAFPFPNTQSAIVFALTSSWAGLLPYLFGAGATLVGHPQYTDPDGAITVQSYDIEGPNGAQGGVASIQFAMPNPGFAPPYASVTVEGPGGISGSAGLTGTQGPFQAGTMSEDGLVQTSRTSVVASGPE